MSLDKDDVWGSAFDSTPWERGVSPYMEVPGELGQKKCASLFTGTDKQTAERKRGLSTYPGCDQEHIQHIGANSPSNTKKWAS